MSRATTCMPVISIARAAVYSSFTRIRRRAAHNQLMCTSITLSKASGSLLRLPFHRHNVCGLASTHQQSLLKRSLLHPTPSVLLLVAWANRTHLKLTSNLCSLPTILCSMKRTHLQANSRSAIALGAVASKRTAWTPLTRGYPLFKKPSPLTASSSVRAHPLRLQPIIGVLPLTLRQSCTAIYCAVRKSSATTLTYLKE